MLLFKGWLVKTLHGTNIVERDNTGESAVAKCKINLCNAPTQGMDREDFVDKCEKTFLRLLPRG